MTASRVAGVVRRNLFALLSLGVAACATAPPPPAPPRATDIPLVDAHSQVNEAVDLTKLIELMDRGGVQRTILSTNGRMTPSELVAFARQHPARITPAASPARRKRLGVDDDTPAFLERQARMGGFGAMAEVLIYHAQKGDVAPLVTADLDAPPVAAALGYAEREGWPFILHIEFNAAGPRREELMRKLETLLTRHPEQPFVLIHMGQLEPSSARRLIEAHGNVYFITSHANPIHAARRRQPWTNMFSSLGTGLSADWRELVVMHSDRFVLGFDNVFAEDWGELYLSQIALWRRALSALPPDVAQAIAHGNAERLWRLSPVQARDPVSPPTGPGGGKRYGMEVGDAVEAIQRGEGRQALAYYEREAVEGERRGLPLDAARAHAAVLFVAYRLGLYQPAVRAGLRALELLKQEPPGEEILWRQLPVYNLVGASYRRTGDLKEARRYFEAGLALSATSTIEGRRLLFAGVFVSSLAWVAELSGDYPLALRHGGEASESLERFLRRLPPSPRFDQQRANARRLLAASLVRVASAERRLGHLGEAEAALRRAVQLAREAGRQQEETAALIALGQVALARRDYDGSREQFQSALTLASRLDSVPQLIFVHAGMAEALAGQGRHAEALVEFQQASALVEDVRSQLQESGLRSGFLEDKQAIYQGAVRSALALGRADEAFSYAERGRARAFLDLLGNDTTLSKAKAHDLVAEELRLRARLGEARAAADDPTDDADPALARRQADAARDAYRAFLDRVRKENLEQASLMTVEPVTLPDVQGLLPEGTTLLEYLVTPAASLLWVVDRSRVEVVRLPVSRRALVTQVRALRQAIAEQAPLEQVQALARALHDRLLAAARPHIRGERLLIVPHDVLHYLPFGALLGPQGRWLIDDHTLATLPSASVLKYLKGKGAAAREPPLAVGNPDLGPALDLRFAEREARAVGARFPGSRVLVRQDATLRQVRALSEEAGLLHFATHGELSEQDPLASALLLTPDGTEDGRLQVREVFGLDLHARLVVLSACETGLGALSRGDELVGLQRAFLYAGTPAVVTTLWKVDDRASYLVMQEFYAGLATLGPAGALREAQRAVMKTFPHPFAWAAFGLTGTPW